MTIEELTYVPFRSVQGAKGYVPVVTRSDFIAPLLCAELSSVPVRYIPRRLNDIDANDKLVDVDPKVLIK